MNIPIRVDFHNVVPGTRLRPVKFSRKDKYGNHRYIFECTCGTETEANMYAVRAKNIKSCGCLQKEKARVNIEKVRPSPEAISRFNKGRTPWNKGLKMMDLGRMCITYPGNRREYISIEEENDYQGSTGN
mgnify:CR=1 FL=1